MFDGDHVKKEASNEWLIEESLVLRPKWKGHNPKEFSRVMPPLMKLKKQNSFKNVHTIM